MYKRYLIAEFERHCKYFQDDVTKLKNKFEEKKAYGFFFDPIVDRAFISWILNCLKEKQNYDTTHLEEKILKFDNELEIFIHNETYLNKLFNELKNLIEECINYFSFFQERKDYFRNNECVEPLTKEYFLKRNEGLFFIDGDDFDSFIWKRTYIEILLTFLENKFNLTELRKKVDKMDVIFKKDINYILKYLDIDTYYLLDILYVPKNYWWLHLKH